MKKRYALSLCLRFLVILLLVPLAGRAQTSETTAAAPDTAQGWRRGGVGTLNLSQVSLVNWAPGGQSSLSVLALGNVFAHHRRGDNTFDTSLDLLYGTLKAGKARMRKNDDKLEYNAKYGHQFTKVLYYAAQVNVKTQLTPTKAIEKPDSLLSAFFAPAFILASVGIDYKPNDQLSVFLSPITGKFTVVANQTLADAGAFGVEAARRGPDGRPLAGSGQRFRSELGAYLNIKYRKPLWENVVFQTKLDLFSNYLHNPQNIDVNWENLISFKVNKFISSSIATNLVYDDDVLVPLDRNGDGVPDGRGRRIQFKETLGIGLTYKF
ncbi:Protein of unknown function [Hymenobacter daecheongensis DSM 21074]|uniref:DUF3078 domain-containing protein n=1 Tax=Hymenobacter daecheongensis DSM 21074 TaxID=1121955 RepID=A0A1M6LG48_9BACT|nr:DUF3078 domain-containing protein [Hymenobacter daecheongensis]SHJ70152.1 Protein of unknown function [Hymenobacter daecheongensis DSM 21074]